MTWDEETWDDIAAAAVAIDYPGYQSASCAIALITGRSEAHGVGPAELGTGGSAVRARPVRSSALPPSLASRIRTGQDRVGSASRRAGSGDQVCVGQVRTSQVRGD